MFEQCSPIGKGQLAQELGWSRPRLDREIANDPGFPILTKGTHGKGYAFELSAVRAHLAWRQGAMPPSVDAGPARAPESDRLPDFVGKSELATRLGWSRPKLDRYIEANGSRFPVVKRGDRSGGWQFSVKAVLAWLDGDQPPSASMPNSLRLFEAQSYEKATAALHMRNLPISAHEPCRTDGLEKEQLAIIAQLGDLLPRERIAGGFEKAVAALDHAACQVGSAICDYVEQRVELLAEDPTIEEMRDIYRIKLRMLGALLDAGEHLLLTLPNVPSIQRNAVRELFDRRRSGIVEDFRPVLT